MVQELLERLLVLQDLLEEKYALEHEIHTLPGILQTKEQLLARLQQSVMSMNEQKEALSENLTNIRINLEGLEGDRVRYESQISNIETQREYEALEKEIKNVFIDEQALRKELNKLTNEYNMLVSRVEKEEELLVIQEEELQNEEKRIKKETITKQNTLSAVEEKVNEVSQDVDQALLFKFRRIIRSKSGRGIVHLKGSVCSGCQMVLPDQFVNNVRDGRSIIFCPYCSKILFYQENQDDEQAWFGTENEGVEGLIDLMDTDENLIDNFEYYSTDDDDGKEEEDEESVSEENDALSADDEKEDDFVDEEEEEETSIELEEETSIELDEEEEEEEDEEEDEEEEDEEEDDENSEDELEE